MLTLRCPRCGTVYTTDCWAPCPSCNGVVRDIGYAIGAAIASLIIGLVAGYVIEKWSVAEALSSYAPANLRGVRK